LLVKMQTAISHWKISPWDWGRDPKGWEKQWRICLRDKLIAMGWGKVGDLRNLSLEEIRNGLLRNYKEYRLRNYRTRLTKDAKQLLDFRGIGKGSIIVANRGQSEIAGIGQVTGDYYYDSQASNFENTLPVKWYVTRRRKIRKQMHWLQTVIPLERQEIIELGILKLIDGIRRVHQYEVDIEKGTKFSRRITRTREFQQAFRNAILEIYQRKCAMCDVDDDDDFLRGCHIVPVKDDDSTATDLRNGICLCVIHDVAFEKGVLFISDEYEIRVSDSFKTGSSILSSLICRLDHKKVRLPSQHLPKKSYLARHRAVHGL
jgi:hypothetical protein